MRKSAAVLVGVAMIFLGSFRADAGTLSLKIHDGLVTLTAQDATIRQVLAEWQKVGRTLFVNADGLTSPPLTLQITNMPERQALDLVLRSAAGYMATPRSVALPDASIYDCVFVLATSTAPPPLPPTPTRRMPEAFYPSPNQNERRIPVFRPRFPAPNGAERGAAKEGAAQEPRSTDRPIGTQVITAPIGSAQPGVIVVPPQKKPGGGGQ